MLILGHAIEQEDVPEDASLVGRISNVTQSVKAGRLVSTAIRLVEIVNTWNIATMSQVSVRMGVFLGIMDYAAHMNNFVNQDTMV